MLVLGTPISQSMALDFCGHCVKACHTITFSLLVDLWCLPHQASSIFCTMQSVSNSLCHLMIVISDSSAVLKYHCTKTAFSVFQWHLRMHLWLWNTKCTHASSFHTGNYHPVEYISISTTPICHLVSFCKLSSFCSSFWVVLAFKVCKYFGTLYIITQILKQCWACMHSSANFEDQSNFITFV
jgi:hypothetical protein